MKKIFFTAITVLGFTFNAYAQECGTLSPANYQTYERTPEERGFERTNIEYAPEICLNVYYPVLREDNGTEGFDENELKDITSLLNQSYNSHNIYFSELGHDLINDGALLYVNSDSDFDYLISQNNPPNAINIYLVKYAYFSGRAVIGGNSFVVRNNKALTSTTPHEMGHCLNLFHTHHGTVYEEGGDTNQCAN